MQRVDINKGGKMNLVYEITERIGDGPRVTRKYRLVDVPSYLDLMVLFRKLRQVDQEEEKEDV